MTPAAIRELRRRLGLGQVAFARAVGLTGAWRNVKLRIYRWERGELPPGPTSVARMVELQGQLPR